MVTLSSQLAAKQLAQMDFEERPYCWYDVLGTVQPDFTTVDSFLPESVREEEGWSAYVWAIRNEEKGERHYQRHLIRKGFRTKQLAKITANYFILHRMINKANEASTDQSAMF